MINIYTGAIADPDTREVVDRLIQELNEMNTTVTRNGDEIKVTIDVTGSVSGGGGTAVGGGELSQLNMQTVANNGQALITSAPRQLVRLKSTGGPITLNGLPFGTITSTVPIELQMFTDTETDTVSFVKNNADYGCLGNFDIIELTQNLPIKATYDPTLKRFFLSRF